MNRNYSVYPSGILFECFKKVRKNFYEHIDEKIHADVYKGEHDLFYAEPEFTGKFLDICAYYYETENDSRALGKGLTVIKSIQQNQHDNGYLGGLEKGNELQAFSVWNQGFTLYGISRMYEVTHDKDILKLMLKTADWILEAFSVEGAPDILEASNCGSQNISVLYSIGRVYLLTNDNKYLSFITKTIEHCETTDMNLLSFDSILCLRSKKGIEMLVVYLGILQYGQLCKNGQAVNAAEKYWQEVYDTQIRNTGNGTIKELWTEGGNAPRLLPTDEKPNETCVAVGWIELSLALFFNAPRTQYLDAIEQTVFNHMLGSLESDGEDLAYYQGNYGKKVFRTSEGAYQCCRYRGFTLFSYLKEYLYYISDNELIPILYSPSTLISENITVVQKTEYPKNGLITFIINNKIADFNLKLRKPNWCNNYTININGRSIDKEPHEGYIILKLPVGKCRITVDFQMTIKVNYDTIENKKYASATFGPLLLALETRFGNELWSPVDEYFSPKRSANVKDTLVHFEYDGLHFIDYSSAGKKNPAEDMYTVYFPVKE